MAAASSSPMMPWAASMAPWAFEPAMSWAYIFWSTGSDAPNRWVKASAPSVNLPDHSAMIAPCW